MWAVHFSMFIGRSFASAIGQAVVIQNFIGSLFNSHLSTVTQGMLYCLAVGLLGGIVQRARRRKLIAQRPPGQFKSNSQNELYGLAIDFYRQCAFFDSVPTLSFSTEKLQIKTMMGLHLKGATVLDIGAN